MKKTMAVVVALVLATLVALLVAPSLIDWNLYRGQIASALGEATGRRVSILGDLDLALLPSPRLTAHDLRVANIEGAVDPELARVAELHLRLGIADLLRGRLVFTRVSLVEPTIALETTADGRAGWDIAPQPPDAGAAERAVRRMRYAVSAHHVDIAGGTLIWRRAGGNPHRFDDVQGQLDAISRSGPLRGQLRLRYRGVPATLSLRAGRPDRNRLIPASGTVALDGGVATLAWTARLDAGTGEVDGTIKLDTPDPVAMLRALQLAGSAPALSVGALSAEARLGIAGGRIALRDITVRLGDTSGSGEATLRLDEQPELAVRMAFPAVDLDSLIQPAGGARTDRGNGGADLAAGRSNLFAGYRGKFELTADTVRLRRGLIREARLSLELAQGVLAVRHAAARLPGGTDMTISGVAEPGPDGLVFDGELAAAADNFRAALVWAGADDSSIPADRLRGFSYTSRISVTPDAIRLTDITARLDATRMRGGATIARRRRPSFGLRLALDRLNLDDYFAPPREASVDDLRPAADVQPRQRGLVPLAAFDANFDLEAQTLTWRGESARRVELSGTIVRGDATLDRLSADDLAGASVVVSGRLFDLGDKPSAVLELAADARDPARAARLLGFTGTGTARRIGPFRLEARIEGTRDRAAVESTLLILGGRISAEGRVADIGAGAAYDFDISMAGLAGDRVLAVIVPGRLPTGIGSVSGRLRAAGSARTLAIEAIEGRIGDTNVVGNLDVDVSRDRPHVGAAIALGNLSLDELLPRTTPGPGSDRPAGRGSARWSRDSFGLPGLRDFDLDLRLAIESLSHGGLRVEATEFDVALANGVLDIDRIAGRAFGGRVAGAAIIDVTGPVPLLHGRLEGAGLEARAALGAFAGFDGLAGPLSFTFEGSASGDNEYALLSSLAGTGAIAGTVRAQPVVEEPAAAGVAGRAAPVLGVTVGGFRTAAEAVTALSRAFADTPATLDGDIVVAGGRAHTKNLRLQGGGAGALTVGDVDLANWTVNTKTTLRRREDNELPYMTLELEGPLDGPDIRSGGTWLRGEAPAALPDTPDGRTGSPAAPAPANHPGADPKRNGIRQGEPRRTVPFILDVDRALAQ